MEEQLIPLMVFDAVALRAVEVLLHEGLIDHEPVGLFGLGGAWRRA